MDRFHAVIENVLDELDCSELKKDLRVICNNRLKTTAGLAKINFDAKHTNGPLIGRYKWRRKAEVHYSPHIFKHMTPDKILNTLTHEACHLCARYKFGRNISPHGKEWKSLMIRMGENPTTCHSVDVHKHGLSKSRKHRVYCECANGCLVGPTVYKRLVRGVPYRCSKCKKTISISPKQSEDNFFGVVGTMNMRNNFIVPVGMEGLLGSVKKRVGI